MQALLNILPWPAWGLICFGIAGLYLLVRPRPRSGDAFARFVLRWMHSLVWLWLGSACFVSAWMPDTTLATILALLGLVSYLVFLVGLVRDRLLGREDA
ncbi:MAG: hypothetical protein SF053_12165 [Bacteroidia bacterium]|nr:hypothetical protein [Bacteroidia bacterium]